MVQFVPTVAPNGGGLGILTDGVGLRKELLGRVYSKTNLYWGDDKSIDRLLGTSTYGCTSRVSRHRGSTQS